jgi:hypothetical protein
MPIPVTADNVLRQIAAQQERAAAVAEAATIKSRLNEMPLAELSPSDRSTIGVGQGQLHPDIEAITDALRQDSIPERLGRTWRGLTASETLDDVRDNAATAKRSSSSVLSQLLRSYGVK